MKTITKILILLISVTLLTGGVMAEYSLPTKQQVIEQYTTGTGTPYRNTTSSPFLIPLSPHLNPIYIYGVPNPVSHIVTSIEYQVMVLDGIPCEYVEEALTFVNPFYKFTFVPVDPTKYEVRDGIKWSKENRLVVISYVSCETDTQGHGGGAVTIGINSCHIPTPKNLGVLIQHECDHEFGDPHNSSSPEITGNYTTSSRSWGTVTISYITGSGTTSWVVNI